MPDLYALVIYFTLSSGEEHLVLAAGLSLQQCEQDKRRLEQAFMLPDERFECEMQT